MTKSGQFDSVCALHPLFALLLAKPCKTRQDCLYVVLFMMKGPKKSALRCVPVKTRCCYKNIQNSKNAEQVSIVCQMQFLGRSFLGLLLLDNQLLVYSLGLTVFCCHF